MSFDWEGILGDHVDIQDAYESLVYDSDKYLGNYYDDYDDDDESDVHESDEVDKRIAKAVEEAFALPF